MRRKELFMSVKNILRKGLAVVLALALALMLSANIFTPALAYEASHICGIECDHIHTQTELSETVFFNYGENSNVLQYLELGYTVAILWDYNPQPYILNPSGDLISLDDPSLSRYLVDFALFHFNTLMPSRARINSEIDEILSNVALPRNCCGKTTVVYNHTREERSGHTVWWMPLFPCLFVHQFTVLNLVMVCSGIPVGSFESKTMDSHSMCSGC